MRWWVYKSKATAHLGVVSFLIELLLAIAAAIVRYLLEIPLIWLGESVWWMVTLGKHAPQWDRHRWPRDGRCVLLSEISFWIGALTAVLIGLGVRALL